MTIYFINDSYSDISIPSLSPTDRGLLLGDGIFETLRAYSGKVSLLDQHWHRFMISANILEIPIPITLEKLSTIITTLLEKNHLLNQDARIRVTLTRGSSNAGLLPNQDSSPTLLVTTTAYKPPAPIERIIVSTIRRNEMSPLCNIKSLNYLDNILALQQAHKEFADDAVLLNTQGNLACTTSANIFIVNAGNIYTPLLTDGALPGIMRRLILQAAQEQCIPIQESTLSLQQLQQAEEIFLSNSLMGVREIKQFGARMLRNTTTLTIQKALQHKL